MACNADCTMVAAGVPNAARGFMGISKGSIFAACCPQTLYSGGEFQVANHVQADGDQKHMDIKASRYEVEQLIDRYPEWPRSRKTCQRTWAQGGRWKWIRWRQPVE